MTITLRQESATGATTKGSTLTFQELDNSFIDLLQNKLIPIQVDADTGSVKVGRAQENGVLTVTGAGGITTTVTEDSAGNANLTITKSTDELGVFEIVGGSNIEATKPDSAGAVTLEVTNPAELNVDGAVVFTAKNTSGSTIEKGQVVYISGHDGTNPTIGLADADDAAKMPAFGLANEQITNNNTGKIITYGPITNINTSFFQAGEELFVNTTNDSAGDTITSTAPTGESGLIQKIGKVIRSHASTGTIFVTGAGRTNATPNLNNNNIFIGNGSNQVSTTAFAISLDSTPQLSGNLDVNGNKIVTVSGNANLKLSPHGTGVVEIEGDGVSADGTIQLNCSQNSHGIKLASPPHSAGQSYTITFPSTAPGANKIFQTDANGDLSFVDLPTGGDSVQEGDNISITSPDSAGGKTIGFRNPLNQPVVGGDQTFSQINLKDYSETVYTSGTTTGTITPDVANGNVQSITLTGSITFSAFSNAAAGQSMTMIIRQPSSGGPYTLTSTMKFAGGTKTLSTTADAYDIMTVFYDGTNYFASLSTNFS
tara:strand:- start:812 stop:2434 length:1623 start_codon:yes stop_codon:yes gene_type:complete